MSALLATNEERALLRSVSEIGSQKSIEKKSEKE